MMVLITYDVSTESDAGKKRLRRVAKTCEDYGQRVQNSVFECIIDSARLKFLQAELTEIIEPKEDSLRFYFLGDDSRHRVEHYGTKRSIDLQGTLIA
jgi:CRISPR-associated protein Cas2